MEALHTQNTGNNARNFTITREINAPKLLVYKAFTEPERMVHWWGPKGLKLNITRMEVYSGGTFLYNMVTPDGHAMWGKFVYKEVSAPDKIVFINSFCDEHGNITRHPMSNLWPLEVINTLTLTEVNNKTILTLSGGSVNATKEEEDTFFGMTDQMQQGFKGTFDQLDEFIGGIEFTTNDGVGDVKEMILTRLLDAPVALIWKLWTEQEHLAKWWAPKGFTNPVCEWIPQKGNLLSIHMKGPDGSVYPMDGEFVAIEKEKKLVFITGALDDEGKRLFEVNNIITFEGYGNKTVMTLHVAVSKIREDAKHYLAGQKAGWSQSFDKLTNLSNSLL